MADKKYIVIADKIRTDIKNGVYAAAGRIPSIRELAKRYGANPQTVNKATAYLESSGFLEPRRGAGSMVRTPAAVNGRSGKVLMLIDRRRSQLLSDLNDLANYHGKDIYLSYLMEASARNLGSGFVVFDRDEPPSAEFTAAVNEASAFLVQGTLPDSWFACLIEADLPSVVINRHVAPGAGRIGSILIPEGQIREMVNYLASLGHTKFIYALSDRFDQTVLFDTRLRILRDAATSWGVPGDGVEVFVYSDVPGKDSGRLASLVSAGYTAAIGFNDVSAVGLYGLASRASLSIPRDLSVTGFDDIVLAQLAIPPLTTIRVDRQHLVRRAFELLDTLALREESCRIEEEIGTSMVIRQSAFRI